MSSFLAFDIETGAQPEDRLRQLMPECELPPHPGEFNPASVKYGNAKSDEKRKEKFDEYKARHEIAVQSYERDAAEKKLAHEAHFIERAALNAGTGQVLAIGCYRVVDGKPKGTIKYNETFDDDGERQLLQGFWGIVSDVVLSKGHRLVGHNIHGFDLPFLIRRSWLLGVIVPEGLLINGRYWHESFIDTMKLWGCGTFNGFIGLDELAKYLGLPGKNGNGADFARLLKTDRQAAINYLQNDLTLTYAVAERLGVR